jgi:hypothetical protein
VAKCRRQNHEISEQGKVWWNQKDIFDAEMVRRMLITDRPRKDGFYGAYQRNDCKVSGEVLSGGG